MIYHQGEGNMTIHYGKYLQARRYPTHQEKQEQDYSD